MKDGSVAWKFLLNKGPIKARNPVFEFNGWDDRSSSVLPAGDVVYVGSADKNMYALDAASGKKIWAFTSQGKIRSSPSIQGKNLLFGTYSGVMHNVNALTGKEIWRLDLESLVEKPSARIAINSTPTIYNDMVFIGSRNTRLHALDLHTGKPSGFILM